MFKNTTKIPKLNLSTTSKFWEREFSIFTMSCWRFSLDIINAPQYGKNSLRIFICGYKEGLAMHFRSYEEEDKFEMIIGKKFVSSGKFRRKIIKLHTYFAKKLLDIYKQINKADKISSILIKNFNVWAGKFFGYNTLIQRGIDYVEKIDVNKRVASSLIKQRTKYEQIVVSQYEVYLNKICEKVAKEKNLASPNLLKLLTVEEFIYFVKNNKLPDDLKERDKLSVLILLPQNILLTGRLASVLLKKLNKQDKKLNKQLLKETTIKGTPIHPGKIRGVIQVITNLQKLKEFKPGNILVAPTTLPKYNHIVNKAKGIITDEGGLLSHGAVLSREFKIPGIVGTKIATRKLKTGQVVEMDASSGIIKIIK